MVAAPNAEQVTSLRHDPSGPVQVLTAFDAAGRTLVFGRSESLSGVYAVEGQYLARLAHIPEPELSGGERAVAVTDEDLLFLARGPEGTRLWSTDGTRQGTGPVDTGGLLDGVPLDSRLQMIGRHVDETGVWLLIRIRSDGVPHDGQTRLERTDLIVRRPSNSSFEVVGRDFRWFPQVRRIGDRMVVLSVGEPMEVRAFDFDGEEVGCDLGRTLLNDFHASFQDRLVGWSAEPEGPALVALGCGETPQVLTTFAAAESLPSVHAEADLLWFQWRDENGGRVRVFEGLETESRDVATVFGFATCRRGWCVDEGPSLVSLRTGRRLFPPGRIEDHREREGGVVDLITCGESGLQWSTVEPDADDVVPERTVEDGCRDLHVTSSRALFRSNIPSSPLLTLERSEGYVQDLLELPPRTWGLGTNDLQPQYAFPSVLGVYRDSTGDGLEFTDDASTARLGPDLDGVIGQTQVGRFVFVGRSTFDFGLQLWVHDSESRSTQFVRSWIAAGTIFHPAPMHLTPDPIGGGAWIAFEDGRGTQLWFSDGTPAGTEKRGDQVPGSFQIQGLLTAGEVPFMLWVSAESGAVELRALDGSGLRRSMDGVWVDGLVQEDGGAWLCVRQASGDRRDIVRFDGDTLQTVAEVEGCRRQIPLGGRIVIAEPELRSTVQRLRVLDSEGHAETLDGPDLGLVRMFPPVASGTHLYFVGVEPERGAELWVSDGSAEGTRRVADVYPGPGSGLGDLSVSSLVPEPRLGAGGLYFIGRDPEAGTRIWVTDGTEEGTEPLAGQPEARLFPPPRFLGRTQGHVHWSAVVDGEGAQVHRAARPPVDPGPAPVELPELPPGDLASASGCTTGATSPFPLALLLLAAGLLRLGARRRP